MPSDSEERSFPQLPKFDTKRLTPAMQSQFAHVQARIGDLGRAMIESYVRTPNGPIIRACFKATTAFNAAAWQHGKSFCVGLGAPVIPLLTILFGALLSDQDVLPRLGAVPRAGGEKLRFAFDFDDLSHSRAFRLALTPERDAAADVLADLCVTFVYAHEIGHIACGHPGAQRYLVGSGTVVEHVSRTGGRRAKALDTGLSRYWEYQADCIGAALMLPYLELLWRRHADGRHTWLRRLATDPADDRALKMHLCALTAAALATMFIYMEGCRLERREESSHPHPIVRSLYVKDRLVVEAARSWRLSATKMGDLIYDRYLEPFLFRLERLGLGSVQQWDPRLLEEMERSAQQLGRGGDYREVARPWSWLPVDEWAQ